jgi:hypothetical protein
MMKDVDGRDKAGDDSFFLPYTFGGGGYTVQGL